MKGLTHGEYLGSKGIKVVLGARVLFITEDVVLPALKTEIEILGDLVFLLTGEVCLINNQGTPPLLLGTGYSGEGAGTGGIERIEA